MSDAIGKRLKELRDLVGIPQAAVAAHLGCDRAYLSLIEGGYRPISDADAAKIMLFLEQEHERKSQAFERLRTDSGVHGKLELQSA